MNFQQLEYFIALSEVPHMTKTAQKLGISQPNLSYAISELEKEVGVPLFKKVGRNIRLSKYGKLYYEQARQAVKIIHGANRLINEERHPFEGHVDFGFIYTMGSHQVPQVTKTFLSDYPDINFSLMQNTSRHLLDLLEDDILDLAIVSYTPGYDKVDFVPLLVEKQILVVPLEHPLANRKRISLRQLQDENWVYYNQNSGLRPYLDQVFAQMDITPNITAEVEDDQSVLGFVSEGFGIALMPEIPSIKAYPVKILEIEDDLPPRLIYLASRQNDYLPPAVKLFHQYCRDFFSVKTS